MKGSKKAVVEAIRGSKKVVVEAMMMIMKMLMMMLMLLFHTGLCERGITILMCGV
jgi:hypothetical protein